MNKLKADSPQPNLRYIQKALSKYIRIARRRCLSGSDSQALVVVQSAAAALVLLVGWLDEWIVRWGSRSFT